MLFFFKNLFQPKLINAALSWQQAGNQAGSAYWLYAVPVHLALQRDTFSLAGVLTLTREESDALRGAWILACRAGILIVINLKILDKKCGLHNLATSFYNLVAN